MKEVFETWLGIFFLTLLLVAGVSIVGSGIDARNADAAKSAYIAEIEESDFSANVIASVLDEASDDGYDVSLCLYPENAAPRCDVTTSDQVGDTSDVYMARVQLDFNYDFGLLNTVIHHQLIGYAR